MIGRTKNLNLCDRFSQSMRLILVISFINNAQIRIVHCIDASCSLSVGAAVELYRVTESIHSFTRKSGWQTLKRDALETT